MVTCAKDVSDVLGDGTVQPIVAKVLPGGM